MAQDASNSECAFSLCIRGRGPSQCLGLRQGEQLAERDAASQHTAGSSAAPVTSNIAGYQQQAAQQKPKQLEKESALPEAPVERQTHYQILGVSAEAARNEIRTAFTCTAKLAHPDKGGSEDEFNNAYIIPDRRPWINR